MTDQKRNDYKADSEKPSKQSNNNARSKKDQEQKTTRTTRK